MTIFFHRRFPEHTPERAQASLLISRTDAAADSLELALPRKGIFDMDPSTFDHSIRRKTKLGPTSRPNEQIQVNTLQLLHVLIEEMSHGLDRIP